MSVPSRILVYGVYGAGKSTLAERLAERLELPWYPVDDLLWQPGWVEVPVALQRSRIEEICRRDRWILDGAYHGWRDVPLARADLVVGLDYPRWLSFWRLLRRTARRLSTGERVCNGNRESWRSVLARDSILVWHVTAFGRARRRMRAWQADQSGPPVLLFDSPVALDRWLAGLPTRGSVDGQTAQP
ncbi:AAA domain-containing protein [Micromonospora nigra]|uniref:AAA domain-containing protein n=1 Tax=Micromonospora nigra TaxID=145857 RepID=A0A1C6RA15_9ACTN|nr:adenylate kinase [Micromonospora nigra]SCL13941.1 AAA domain-containing protein [Micromonospora nigra]